MITILSYFIIILLGTWLLLSVIAQFRDIKVIKWINDRDPFVLLPTWTFFAPNPGVTDYQLFYRDKHFDGRFTSWEKIQYHEHSIFHSFLNPDKRIRKAITECCIDLLQTVKKNPNDKLIIKSFPYLLLSSYIMSIPRSPMAEFRQFSIIRTFGFVSSKEPYNEFTSSLHTLHQNYDSSSFL